MIMPTEGEYALRLTQGAIDHAARLPGVELIDIGYTYGDPQPLAGHAMNFEGAIVWLDRDDRWAEELLRKGIKVVNTNGEWPEEIMPCVGFDGEIVRQQVMDHVIELGRKNAAHVSWATAASALHTKHREEFSPDANSQASEPPVSRRASCAEARSDSQKSPQKSNPGSHASSKASPYHRSFVARMMCWHVSSVMWPMRRTWRYRMSWP